MTFQIYRNRQQGKGGIKGMNDEFEIESSQKTSIKHQELPIPTSPVIVAALRALYAGGSRNC